MVVAIPIFGCEISPRLDCAKEFLLIRVEGGKIAQQKTVIVRETNPLHLAKTLSALQVRQVVCNGIDDFCFRMLNGMGIQVFPWFSGNAHKTLEKFLTAGKP